MYIAEQTADIKNYTGGTSRDAFKYEEIFDLGQRFSPKENPPAPTSAAYLNIIRSFAVFC